MFPESHHVGRVRDALLVDRVHGIPAHLVDGHVPVDVQPKGFLAESHEVIFLAGRLVEVLHQLLVLRLLGLLLWGCTNAFLPDNSSRRICNSAFVQRLGGVSPYCWI